MEKSDYKNFINAVVALARVLYLVEDKFFAQKLYKKLSNFMAEYVKFSAQTLNVAQSVPDKELLSAINSLLELSEYLEYYKTINRIPLLLAKRRLLFVKLDLLKLANKMSLLKQEVKENPHKLMSENLIKSSVANTNLENDDIRLSVNKEKIIRFIKKYPSVRTKDIIEEFSILSARTIKRNLSELTQDGFLRRSAKDKAVFYSTI